jgi:hypothetical protein
VDDQTLPLVLRPVRSTIIATTVVCGVFVVIGLVVLLYPFTLDDPSPGDFIGFTIFGGPIIAIFLFMMIRTWTEKLVLAEDYALVRNIFYTRRIPRDLVLGWEYATAFFAAGNPAIRWQRKHKRGERARVHITRINFLTPAALELPIDLGGRDVEAMSRVLHDWCDASPGVNRPKPQVRKLKDTGN